MQKIAKFKRSNKGLSPIISVLLLIAIAVVASLVAYAWIMGFLGTQTTKAGNAIQIQSFTQSNGYLAVYVQNTGQGIVNLKQDGSAYVNSTLHNISESGPPLAAVTNGAKIPIPLHSSVEIITDYPVSASDYVNIKITTMEGTFIQASGIVTGIATSHFAVTSGTSQTAGTAFTLQVQAVDSSGAVVTTYTGIVHLSSSDAKAGLPSDYTFTKSDAGVHTFSVTLNTVGTQTVSVTDTNTNTITGSQKGIAVVHGAIASVTISGSTSQVVAGSSVTYGTTAKDSSGNSWDVTGSTTFSIDSGAGGQWSGSLYNSQYKGTWTVTGTVTGFSGTQPTTSLTVSTGTIVSASISGSASSIAAGQPVTFTATATDSSGNNWDVTGSTTFSIDSSAGGQWNPANTYNSQYVGTNFVVTGTVSGFAGPQPTTNLAVTPGAAANVAVTATPSTITAGQTSTFSATVTDSEGNQLSGQTVTWTIDANAGGSIDQNTGIYTSQKVGSWQVTGTVTGTSVSNSITLNVQGGTPTTLTVAVSPTTAITAGGTATFSAQVTDGQGNTWDVTGSTTFAVDPNAGGSWSSATIFNTQIAGTWTVTGTYTSTSGTLTGTQTFTVTPQTTLSKFTVTVSGSYYVNSQIPITVSASDNYGNVITSYTGPNTLALTVNGAAGTMSPTATGTFTQGSWSGSVTASPAGTAYITTTENDGHGSLTGKSGNFVLLASSSGKPYVAFTPHTSQTLGAGVRSTVITIERYSSSGTPITSGSLTVDLSTSSSGGAFYPAQTGQTTISSVTIANGAATATFYYQDDKIGSPILSITATDTSQNPPVYYTGDSLTFTINPGNLAGIQITDSGGASLPLIPTEYYLGDMTDGQPFTITISAVDSSGNTVTSASGAVTLKDTSGTLTPTTVTLTNGQVIVSTTTIKALYPYSLLNYYLGLGLDTITATYKPGTTTYTGTAVLFVDPGPMASFKFSTISGSLTANNPFQVTITALDSGGNTATGYDGSATITDALNKISPNPTSTNGGWSNGVWTGTVDIAAGGSDTLIVKDGTISAISN